MSAPFSVSAAVDNHIVRTDEPRDWVETKRCTSCHQEKPLSAFGRHRFGRFGRNPQCKECNNSRARKWHAENLGIARVRTRARRLATYGLDENSFAAMVAAQNNRCAICQKEFSESIRYSIDHDHSCCPGSRGSCGKCVRGLLCMACNGALGKFDNDDWMGAVYRYLIQYQTRREMDA